MLDYVSVSCKLMRSLLQKCFYQQWIQKVFIVHILSCYSFFRKLNSLFSSKLYKQYPIMSKVPHVYLRMLLQPW